MHLTILCGYQWVYKNWIAHQFSSRGHRLTSMGLECCGPQICVLPILLLLHIEPNCPQATFQPILLPIRARLYSIGVRCIQLHASSFISSVGSYHSLVNASVDTTGKNMPLMLQLMPMANSPRFDEKYFNTVRYTLMTHTLECWETGRRGICIHNHTPTKKLPYLTGP